MDLRLARRRLGEARVGRLGTTRPDGRPHLVPCCFAIVGETVYTAIDSKPKSTLRLRRVDNILENPATCLLVDNYEEDWSSLWWVRLDGTGRVVASPLEIEEAKRALTEKYQQYRHIAIPGPVIAIEVSRWSAWP
jgi:PPOX class probable F420-dependent enzyme